MSQKPPNASSMRYFGSTGYGDPLAADDISVTDWDKSNEFILVFQFDEAAGPWNAAYSLRWRNKTDSPSGSFTTLASSGELAWGTGTALVNGDPLTSQWCTNTPGGSTWQNGEQVEGAATSDSINLADEYYSEVAWAVDPSAAHSGDEYEFQLWDETNGSEIVIGAATITMSSGGVTVIVGIPAGAGAPLATTQIGAALIAAGLPSGLGEAIAPVISGDSLAVVGIPSGAGAVLSAVISGAAFSVVGLPSGVGQALPTSQLFDYVFSVGLPSGLGEAIAVTVVTPGGDELVIVGLPSGAGQALPVTHIGGALTQVGIPAGVAQALSAIASCGTTITVGIPAGAGEALATAQLFDYVVSVGVPAGAGVALPVTVYTDGVPAFTFYISQIVPLEE